MNEKCSKLKTSEWKLILKFDFIFIANQTVCMEKNVAIIVLAFETHIYQKKIISRKWIVFKEKKMYTHAFTAWTDS